MIKNYFKTTVAASLMALACTQAAGQDIPAGAIVWEGTKTLTESFIVPKGQSLYIKPGTTIVAATTGEESPAVEIVVLGNLYSLGTEKNPVTFTVADNLKGDRFGAPWGGIICGYDSKELYLDHTIIEYGGAPTTELSTSFVNGLYKTDEPGDGVPAVHFCNVDGSMVIRNCTFRYNANDQIYITGGKSIVENNLFYESGNAKDGGEAINYKSGCDADICYNVIYDACTNGFKLSNAGVSATIPSSHLNVYNNTLIDCGWRRAKNEKGGSFWIESGIVANIVNNLVYDCRWGMKHDTEEPESPSCVLTPNFYFSSTSTGIEQSAADDVRGILAFSPDIRSTQAGNNNPLFAHFTQTPGMDINVSADEGDGTADPWDSSWDLSIAHTSPAAQGGKTDLTTLFSTKGITLNGLAGVTEQSTFTSKAPAAYFGAKAPVTTDAIGHAPTTTGDHTIYTLDGRRAGTSSDRLPRGLYIQNGKKLYVR